jgi:serine/threonine-protein kinase
MEYFPSRSLKEWLETHDRMPGPDILSVATQIADAIDFAHSEGIVHRDIKPSNILIESTPRGRVVLSDFGVARVFGAVQRQITATSSNELVGSPAFLAPEALGGQEISEKSDIYSFGVVLYEMITGKDPFARFKMIPALLHEKVNKDAPDIREFRKDVPKSVAVRLAQTLSRDPTKRPRSARAVLAGIEDAINGL